MTKHQPGAAFTSALPLQVRYADTSNTFNPESRTVDVVASTGASVTRTRYDGWEAVRYEEELVISEKAIDLSRLNDGAAVLDSHDAHGGIGSSLGIVERAWIEGGKLMATIRLHAEGVSIAADALAGMIRGGTAPKISIGYVLNKVRVIEPKTKDEFERWVVERWTPFEVSFVTVPADAGAGIRNKDETFACEFNRATPPKEEEVTMTEQVLDKTSAGEQPVVDNRAAVDAAARSAVEVERKRISAIRSIADAHKVPADLLNAAIETGASVDAFRGQVLDHLATAQERTPIISATSRASGDDPAVKRAAMIDAMSSRILRKAPEGEMARSFMGHGFADMAAELMGDKRRLSSAVARDEVLHRAFHTTSDFPGLLENVANKVLNVRYEAAAPTYRTIAAQRTFMDFKPHSMVRPGDFPNLLQVGETGEIKAGSVSESKETVSLATYARQIRISRNVLVNDDLGAIQDVIGSIGQRIADFENATFWTMFASNPTLATDSTAVWASGHGNLAGSGAAISITTLSAGRAAMMKQTSLDGLKLNIVPRYLVVSPDKLTEAEQMVTPIVASQSSNVNTVGPRLQVVADANLSGNAWYLMADPAAAAAFVYGFLDGQSGPQTRIDEPFGVLGTALQVVLDFGCGAIDYRGAYKNPG